MKEKIASDKVAIYIRWSTEDQGQGHTLEIQRDSCRYYCMSQGWAVREDLTFIDEGYSGGTLERPALTRLRQAVKDGKVDCAVVYKLDRLSRNIKDIINLVLDEWEDRCSVRSTQEPVDTTSDAGKMFFTMLGSFADFERSSIKTRTWAGKRKNAEKGRNPGVLYSYGFLKGEDGGWAVEETEAIVVREIFDHYIKGKSCRLIAFGLNDRGLRTRSGRMWHDAEIARVLANPIYIGRLVYNRRSWAAKKKLGRIVNNDPAEVVTIEGATQAIVPMDVWEQVQQIRASRPRIGRAGRFPRNQSSPHLLSGLLKCSRCGHSWIAFTSGKGDFFYQCAGARTAGPAKCSSRMIKRTTLDRFIVDRVRETWPLKGSFRTQMFASVAQRLAEHDNQVQALQHRYATLDGALSRFKADYTVGKLSADVFTELTDEVRSEREKIAAFLREADNSRRQVELTEVDLRAAETAYCQIDEWKALTQLERQSILRHLIAEIRLHRPKGTDEVTLHVEWKLPRMEDITMQLQ